MDAEQLEELKFHWEKWKSESKAFFGRALLATPLLILSILFQWQAISVEILGVKQLSHRPLFYWFIWSLSVLLLFFLIFKFVDMLRHRVPEKFEGLVHTNLLPNPVRPGHEIDLKRYGRYLWFVFVIYAGLLGGALLATAYHLLSI